MESFNLTAVIDIVQGGETTLQTVTGTGHTPLTDMFTGIDHTPLTDMFTVTDTTHHITGTEKTAATTVIEPGDVDAIVGVTVTGVGPLTLLIPAG